MDVFITAVICLPAGMVAGGILVGVFGRKVSNAVMAELNTFKAEVRAKLR